MKAKWIKLGKEPGKSWDMYECSNCGNWSTATVVDYIDINGIKSPILGKPSKCPYCEAMMKV